MKVIACIDIGGTSMKVGVCDKKGQLSQQDILPVHSNFDDLINEIVCFVEEKKKNNEIIGLAMSAPGAVDVNTGIIGGCSALPCIHGPNWKRVLAERLNMPISIENDANCAALAEIIFGDAKEYHDMAFVVCGTGIGGAIVKDKKIHHGAHLYGGEFGCMVMNDEFGNISTFSTEASTMSFVRKIQKLYPNQNWDGVKVFEEAKNGNKDCQKVIDTFYRNLAIGIYNVQHVYDPQIILLGGAISNRDDFISSLNDKIDELLDIIQINVVRPHIATCTFKKDANLIGAVAHYLQEHESL